MQKNFFSCRKMAYCADGVSNKMISTVYLLNNLLMLRDFVGNVKVMVSKEKISKQKINNAENAIDFSNIYGKYNSVLSVMGLVSCILNRPIPTLMKFNQEQIKNLLKNTENNLFDEIFF